LKQREGAVAQAAPSARRADRILAENPMQLADWVIVFTALLGCALLAAAALASVMT
jgi:hypothetical protein